MTKLALPIFIAIVCTNFISLVEGKDDVDIVVDQSDIKKFTTFNKHRLNGNFSYCSQAKQWYHTTNQYCHAGELQVKECEHACADRGYNRQIPVHLIGKSVKQDSRHSLTCSCMHHCGNYARAKGIQCYEPYEITTGRGDRGDEGNGLGRDTILAPHPSPEPEGSSEPWRYGIPVAVVAAVIALAVSSGMAYWLCGSQIIATCKDSGGNDRVEFHRTGQPLDFPATPAITPATPTTTDAIPSVLPSLVDPGGALGSDLNAPRQTTLPNTFPPGGPQSSPATPDRQAGDEEFGPSRPVDGVVCFKREGDASTAHYQVETETTPCISKHRTSQRPAHNRDPHTLPSGTAPRARLDKQAPPTLSSIASSSDKHARKTVSESSRPAKRPRSLGPTDPLLCRDELDLRAAVGPVGGAADEARAPDNPSSQQAALDLGTSQSSGSGSRYRSSATAEDRNDSLEVSRLGSSNGGFIPARALAPADPVVSGEEPRLQGADGGVPTHRRGPKRSTTKRGHRSRSCEPRLSPIEEEPRASQQPLAEQLRSFSLSDVRFVNLAGEEGGRGRWRPEHPCQDPENAVSWYMLS